MRESVESVEIQRVKAIKDLVKNLFIKVKGDTIFVPIKDLSWSQISVEQTLNALVEQTHGLVNYSARTEPLVWKREASTANLDPAPIAVESRVVGYEIWLSDPKKIDEYFAPLLKRGSRKMSRSKHKPFYGEVVVGDLEACGDGVIRFRNKVVEMRPQLISLCWLFMDNLGSLETVDDIREKIIPSKKRELTSNATIAKYVSELHKVLESLYQRQVIFNVKENGWRFDPEQR